MKLVFFFLIVGVIACNESNQKLLTRFGITNSSLGSTSILLVPESGCMQCISPVFDFFKNYPLKGERAWLIITNVTNKKQLKIQLDKMGLIGCKGLIIDSNNICLDLGIEVYNFPHIINNEYPLKNRPVVFDLSDTILLK